MSNREFSLKEIAYTSSIKESSPKKMREAEINELSELLMWIEIAKERTTKEIVTQKTEVAFLRIIKKQFTGLQEIQLVMAKLMTEYSALMANQKYFKSAISKVNKKVDQLERIEKLTNKGGRKPNKEIYEIANSKCFSEYAKTGKKPSGGKLSLLVETEMLIKYGSHRENGNRYLSERSARNFLKQWQVPIELNRQELVKSFSIK